MSDDFALFASAIVAVIMSEGIGVLGDVRVSLALRGRIRKKVELTRF